LNSESESPSLFNATAPLGRPLFDADGNENDDGVADGVADAEAVLEKPPALNEESSAEYLRLLPVLVLVTEEEGGGMATCSGSLSRPSLSSSNLRPSALSVAPLFISCPSPSWTALVWPGAAGAWAAALVAIPDP
jgi:hypothetical protein